jgi:hypothetical protein
MNLFTLMDKSFTLHSGGTSRVKLECDALTDADWECVAYMLWERLPPFGWVKGIPRGGLKLAQALVRRSFAEQPTGPSLLTLPFLLVDDVLTTGRSMEEERARIQQADPRCLVLGAVLFARNPGPDWIYPLCPISGKWNVEIGPGWSCPASYPERANVVGGPIPAEPSPAFEPTKEEQG